MMIRLRLILFCFLLLSIALASVGHAQRLRGQAVTWADFGFVHAVTSSISHTYFATTGGIIRFDKLQQRWEAPLTGADGLDDEIARRIWVDRFDERLYIQTDFGYYEYNKFFERWQPLSELPQIDNGDRHLRALDVLLPSFNANYLGDGRFVDIYGRSYATTDIVDDGNGNLWIGTWGFGPARAEPSSRLMDLLPYGLLQNRITVMQPDDTVIWLAGTVFNDYRTGLTAFNPETNNFFHVESGIGNSFPAVDVNCLEIYDEQIYIGTPLGIYEMQRDNYTVGNPINRRRGLPDENVLAMCARGDSLYVGTAGGMAMVDLKSDSVYQVRPETFFNHAIYDLEPVDNTIWIASALGAYRYSIEDDRLQKFQDPDLLLFNEVYEIKHFENSLWLAADAGVVRLDLESGKSESFLNPSQRTYSRALAVNDRIVALASDGGMTIFFFEGDRSHTREFTPEDGLASSTVYSLLLDGDYIWIGTDRGVTRFYWNNPERVD